jgi:hypothetical protein
MVANVNRIVVSIAAGLSAVLVVFAGGYGYHRDELYFVAAGRHLDWAYPHGTGRPTPSSRSPCTS